MDPADHRGIAAKLITAWEDTCKADDLFGDYFETLGIGWDYDRIGCDSYDNSLEIMGAPDDATLTAAQAKAILDCGFSQCWITHKDGGETYFSDRTGTPKKGTRRRDMLAAQNASVKV